MKFNKIKEVKPEFNKMVILVEKDKDNMLIKVGYLESIDGLGCNWSVDNSFFGMGMSKFKPQYWAEIDLTEIEKQFNNE